AYLATNASLPLEPKLYVSPTIKLFVNGERVTTNQPYMLLEVSNITILDFANSILYQHTYNFTVNGIYIDIGLPIMYVTITNNKSAEVIVYLTKNSVTMTIPIAAGFSIDIRIATGAYHYVATYRCKRDDNTRSSTD
ncbi:MAG: hypothetical protein Q6370_004225, partial [Candidatus Sigynarchaeota archaeon]